MYFKNSVLSIAIAFAMGCSSLPDKTVEDIRSTRSFESVLNYETQYDLVENYNRSELNGFVNNVLKNNYDINYSTLNLISSLYQVRLTDTNINPSFSGSTSASKNKNLETGTSGNTQYSTALSLSYEVDLWNKLKNERIAKVEEFKASEQDRETIIISTIALLEESYFKIAYLNDSINYTKGSIDYYNEILRIAELKYAEGKTAYVDVLEAKKTVTDAESDLKDLYIENEENLNLFLKLQGMNPSSKIEIKKTSLLNLAFKPIPEDTNFSLIINRPDVNAAYNRYIASFNNLEVTKKSYLPTFKLTSNIGFSSDDLSNLISNPVGTLGANIVLPFLNINEKKWNIAVSANELELRKLSLENTLLTSSHEISNSINNYTSLLNKTENIKISTELTQQISNINKLRYENGSVSITDWLNAEEAARKANMNLIQHNYNLVLAKINLYKSLGGKI